jgi:hypothetical protein
MTAHVKSSGSWNTLTNLYVKVSGTWRNVTAGYVKVSGTWRTFFGGVTAPGQVTGLTATDFGTSRSYNSGRIDLSWTAPSNGGSAITGYFIEYSINGVTYFTLVSNTGTTSTTYTDIGLTSGQIYYYRVSAINAIGTGIASTAASATATTVPQTPTVSASVSSSTQVSLSFSGATGGKALSSLTITSSPSISLSYTGTSSPITVTGSYAANQAYTFTMSATNANGTSGTSAASNSVTPNVVSAPVNTVAPVVTPSSGTAGTTTYSCTTGTWTNSPTSYAYQWQYNDSGSLYLNISGATSSTYSPPSNFFSLGYFSPIRCRVTASNAGGSNQAFSNTATVAAPLSPPSGGIVTLSGTGVAGTSITATTSGWSNSPTSYSVRIYASTTNPPTTSDILKASSSSSSVSYTVTTFDASPPPYYFKAFATATNAAGTSSEVGSNVILSSLGAPSTPGTPTMTYDSANSTASNWAYDITWTASTGSGTIQYQLDCQASNDQSTILSTATRPSSGFYSSTSQQDVLLSRIYTFWRCRVRATNDGGTTWSSYSGYSNWA